MRRTGFAAILSLGLIALPIVAVAQPADKTSRIGYLAFNLGGGDPRMRASFLQGLRDLGYVEGRSEARRTSIGPSHMTRARAGALAVVATPVFDSARRRLVELAEA